MNIADLVTSQKSSVLRKELDNARAQTSAPLKKIPSSGFSLAPVRVYSISMVALPFRITILLRSLLPHNSFILLW